MSNTEKLKDMLDNLINGKPEQAQTVFHSYLKDKIQGVFGATTPPTESTQIADVDSNK